MSQSDTITVINRTGRDVFVGIDNESYGVPNPAIAGRQAQGVLTPGQTSGFVTISGAPPYQVGFFTSLSGYGLAPGYTAKGVIVPDVFPNAIVTLTTTLGTRPDPAADDETSDI
ncbi:MAG: hypothetical protein AAGC60_07215 [Acidobacteriota bacterium]